MSTPTFLGLPQELRDEIYRHLFGPRLRIKPAEQGDNTLLPTSILQASKQISVETQQILLKEYSFIFSEWQVLKPQWPTILKAPNLRIRVDFYDSETVGLYLALCLSSHRGLRNLHVEVTVTRLSSLETLMCPNVCDILATIPIRDSVALSVTVKDYSYRSWGVNHSVKDLQEVRKRLRSQMKEQEGWLQEQIAVRKEERGVLRLQPPDLLE